MSSLVFDAIDQTSRIVEGMHATIAAAPLPFERATDFGTNGVTRLVYRSVRLVNETVRAGMDAVLRRLPFPPEPKRSAREWDAVRSAINGVLGDHLVASENPLAIPMAFRRNGRSLPLDVDGLKVSLPDATGKVLVLVHGLCMSDRQWRRNGHDHGAALQRDLGYTSVYSHYNSGRHVSENGRELAALLEMLLAHWPVPVTELTILAHSLGGLVARSAYCFAAETRHQWPARLRSIVFLGTPHHGTPLERGGNWVQWVAGISPYTAPLSRLGMLRSAGITDLRFGNLVDEDWKGCDRFEQRSDERRHLPLPAAVGCYAIAATLAKRRGTRDDRLLGDGLVPVASALGLHASEERCLGFLESNRWVGLGMNHWDLLDRPEVYAKLAAWLSGAPAAD